MAAALNGERKELNQVRDNFKVTTLGYDRNLDDKTYQQLTTIDPSKATQVTRMKKK